MNLGPGARGEEQADLEMRVKRMQFSARVGGEVDEERRAQRVTAWTQSLP